MGNKILIIGLLFIVFAWGCEKNDSILMEENETTLKTVQVIDDVYAPCYEEEVCFIAGQTIDVGSFFIGNDLENLYLKYETSGDWLIKEVHYTVVSDLKDVPKNRPGNLIIGHFPFTYSFMPYVAEVSFTHSLEELDYTFGDQIYVVAHAVVVQLDEYGEIIEDETAFGGCEEGNSGNRWWFYAGYTVTECEPFNPGPEDFCWGEETAYGGDSEGGGGAWWYYFDLTTFDADNDEYISQNIYAGQELVDGASVSYDGETLTIVLGENMRLQDDDESVKIQGYNDDVPDSRPASGGFNTYKGNDLVISVGDWDWDYLVIHLDVEVKVECPAEE